MVSSEQVNVIADYLRGLRSQAEVIAYFQDNAATDVNEGTRHIAAIKRAVLSDEEAEAAIRYALVPLLKQESLTPENAEAMGYEWVGDSIFPTEAPQDVLLSFLEDLKRDNLVVGQAVGSYPEEA